VDDSLRVANNVLSKGSADIVLFSGIVGNVVLAAAGYNIGPNMDLIEKLGYASYISPVRNMLKEFGDKIRYPLDVALNIDGKRIEAAVKEMGNSPYSANDIGLETIVSYTSIIKSAGTVVLNGPAGVCENPDFAIGTHEIIRAATNAEFSIIGGGHISAEVSRLGMEAQFSHSSTGGGACIEYLSGVQLPGIQALKDAAARKRNGFADSDL
jgi:phosphoglycerate kinase